MTGKTVEQIKKALIEEYKKDFPGEDLYGKVFSLYILTRHAKLLHKIYEKASNKKEL